MKRIPRLIYLAGLTPILVAGVVCGDQAGGLERLKPEVEEIIRHAREFSRGQVDTTSDKLASELTESVAKEARSREGEDVLAKVVLLAWDRKANTKRHEEIYETYFNRKNFPPRLNNLRALVRLPPLQDKHCVEEYRLAWEYILLRGDEGWIGAQWIGDALLRIGNPACVPTALQAFRNTVRGPLPLVGAGGTPTHQSYLLHILFGFRNEISLQAILECLSLDAAQRSHLQGEEKIEVEKARAEMLHSPEWKKIMDQIDVKTLSKEQAEVLDRLKKRIAEMTAKE